MRTTAVGGARTATTSREWTCPAWCQRTNDFHAAEAADPRSGWAHHMVATLDDPALGALIAVDWCQVWADEDQGADEGIGIYAELPDVMTPAQARSISEALARAVSIAVD